jgi:hypothetical protein
VAQPENCLLWTLERNEEGRNSQSKTASEKEFTTTEPTERKKKKTGIRILNSKWLQKRNLQPQSPQSPQREKRKNRDKDSQFKMASEKEFNAEAHETQRRREKKNRDCPFFCVNDFHVSKPNLSP